MQSCAKYADPVADLLDKWGVFRARLFRESCVFYRGNYVKHCSAGVGKWAILLLNGQDEDKGASKFEVDQLVPRASDQEAPLGNNVIVKVLACCPGKCGQLASMEEPLLDDPGIPQEGAANSQEP
ncbi:hypothetical protein HPB51_028984 [Rhipicephalus microplus]|uniref:FCP1 homology domain-containing protein n=1 Tax=Rhipicephalus microplus TaxID=6941 RepID=A0A9J6CVI7_RHIMP|nr:hypothetical protein HPB51_028984 [Rhipicephalus microplus]